MGESTADDLAMYIHNNGLAVMRTNLFTEDEPETAVDNDPCITIYSLVSEKNVYVYGQRDPIIDTTRLRIWVRSKVFDQASALAYQVYHLLQKYNVPINGSMYQFVRATSGPVSMGPDKKNRQQLSMSIRTRKNNS